MNKTTLIIYCIAALAMLGGCKVSNRMACPELATKHDRVPLFAKLNHGHHHKTKPGETNATNVATAAPVNHQEGIDIKLPKMMTKHLQPEEIAQANEVFRSASNNKVSLAMGDNNRVHFKAQSISDFNAMARAMFTAKPAAAPGGGGGLAIASGVLGIIAFVLAFGPYVGFGSFVLGLLAVIFGVLGLFSPRRGWAIAGIVLGVLAILIAIGFIFVFIRFI
jgi:hypothetical protein